MSSDADRFFEGETHGIIGDRVNVAKDLGRESAVVFEASCHIVDVELSFDNWLAAVASFEFSQHGRILANFFGETEEHTPALLGGGGRPGTVVKGSLGGGDGTIHVVNIGIGNLREDLFIRGIIDGESLIGPAVDPVAIYIHLISADFGFYSGWHKDLLLENCESSFARHGRPGRPSLRGL